MKSDSHRVIELDGLRGVCALSVVIFHYLCLLHPNMAHNIPGRHADIVHTPISAFWNGHFAVWIFFGLSGFAMAAAAQRYHQSLMALSVQRYLRFAIPITASVIMAWALLTLLPEATAKLAALHDNPSRWLEHTYQGDIPSLGFALYDGSVRSFLHGGSHFNNVLWTMRYELIGSLALIATFRLTDTRHCMVALTALATITVIFNKPRYMAFVLGAIIHEMHIRHMVRPYRSWLPPLALGIGLAWGSLTSRTLPQYGIELPDLPVIWSIGFHTKWPMLVPTVLILLSCLTMPALRRVLCLPSFQWLGRISFSLYLVHVPMLYTLVAHARAEWAVPSVVLLPTFLIGALATAYVFTNIVEAPAQRFARRVIHHPVRACDVRQFMKR